MKWTYAKNESDDERDQWSNMQWAVMDSTRPERDSNHRISVFSFAGWIIQPIDATRETDYSNDTVDASDDWSTNAQFQLVNWLVDDY